jgi:hypothetical protein
MRTAPLFLALVFVLPIHAQDKPVPVVDEPMHQTVLEHPLVRLIDVQIRPDATTLYHIHVVPSVIIYLTKSTNRSESWPSREILTRDVTPGQSRYAPYDEKPLTHRVTNTGTGLFRVFDIELLNRPATNLPLPTLTSPLVKLHWEENLARSSGIHLGARGKVEIPASRAATLIVPISGSVQVTTGDANAPAPRILNWGDWQFFPAQTRLAIQNSGAEPAEAVLLELKN